VSNHLLSGAFPPCCPHCIWCGYGRVPSPYPFAFTLPFGFPSPSQALLLPFRCPIHAFLSSFRFCYAFAFAHSTSLGHCLYCFCPITLGCWSVSRMPKLVESLLQVKERQTRELKLRTQARCAELLGGPHPESSRHHSTPEPVSVCPCYVCRGAHLSPSVSDAANYILDDDKGSSLESNCDIHRPLKEWFVCINVSCFLLILCAGNCLFLQYILLHKADSC
jgi:hypothetical protein